MLDQHSRHRRLPRLIMLLVGLLYLVGAVAEPIVHVYGGSVVDVGTVSVGTANEGPAPSGTSLPHMEAQCLLCKVSAPIALGHSALVVKLVLVADPGVRMGTGISRAPPALSASQPRAPPSA